MVSYAHLDWSKSSRLKIRLSDFGASILRLLPPESAHELTLGLLKRGWLDRLLVSDLDLSLTNLRINVPGIGTLRHPIGLAAGMDKNCFTPLSFVKMGFSFLEIGTVTPLPQRGNPKPRLFRQSDKHALVNRMGFNSLGSSTILQRLERLNWDHDLAPLGVNIGKNKRTELSEAIEDYVSMIDLFKDSVRFFVCNISSPNTPNLRSLANPDFVSHLAERVGPGVHKIFVKLDPDLDKRTFQGLIEAIANHGFRGVILTNTHKVNWPQSGGMSGSPLGVAACARLEWAYEVHKGVLPMIGVGGIFSGFDVYQRLIRGASLVEIYSALVYRGPWAVAKILIELLACLEDYRVDNISDIIGTYYTDGL